MTLQEILNNPNSIELVEYELSEALLKQGARPNVYPRLTAQTTQQIEKDILELIGDNDIVEFGDPLLSPTHADLKARARDELRQELRLKLKEYIGGSK